MRKICLFLLLICLFNQNSNGQYVSVDDNSFRNFLYARYPGCFNASMELDTTCTAIVTEDTLIFPRLTLPFSANLVPLQYFDSLKYLDISVNYM